jgi:molybdopterin/thiamine biosynthesis adenylyltransferase
MLIGNKNVVVMDRDTLERKNLNRQLFTDADIGKNKARALGEKHKCEFIEGFYSFGIIAHSPEDWLFSCVDNHAGRLAILRACDEYGCQAIIAANEKHSAEAYLYRDKWKDSPLDPRVYYPDILTDQSDDPTRPEGCTGEAQVRTPQLVSANVMAISLAQWLFVLWHIKMPELDRKFVEPLSPHHLRANMSRLETFTIEETLNARRNNNTTESAAP